MVVAAAATPIIPTKATAMYNKDLFQGDIKGIAGQEPGKERAAILGTQYLWSGGVVPYVWGSSITSSQQSVIEDAFADFHAKTCIRFVPRTTESDYLEIVSDDSGCWSYVGSIGGMQRLSLQANGCMYVGSAIHELMHAVGFFHEHTRYDRDTYVTIHFENIEAGQEDNFEKDSNYQIVGEGYNYYSIMHYDSYAFSSNGGMTIEPTDDNVVLTHPAYRYEMEQSDANQINNLYAGIC